MTTDQQQFLEHCLHHGILQQHQVTSLKQYFQQNQNVAFDQVLAKYYGLLLGKISAVLF